MDKRERLLLSAAELFTERGIQNTSTAAISRHAGVATGTLFNYFSSKDDLITQLFLWARESMIAATAVDTLDTSDYYEAFSILWTRGVSWGCDNPRLFWFVEEVSRSAFRSNGNFDRLWFDSDLIADFINLGIERGIVLDVPFEIIHTVILSVISGIVEKVLISNVEKDLFIQRSRDIIWRALHAEDS